MKKVLATLAAVTVAALAFASPASATDPDPHYATGAWALQDWTGPYPDVVTSDATLSTVECDTVMLVKPDTADEPVVYPPTGNGDFGTSYENTDLDLDLPDGGVLQVDYALSEAANADAGAVRMFAYDSPGADTLNTAPTFGPAIAPSGPTAGTLEIVFAGPVTLHTFGLAYDASNDTEGTVTFTDLRVVSLPEQQAVTTPISFCAAPEPEPSPTATEAGPAAPQLPKTGSSLGPVLLGGAVLVLVGVALVAVVNRRRVTR